LDELKSWNWDRNAEWLETVEGAYLGVASDTQP
jgi:hypothetical protein